MKRWTPVVVLFAFLIGLAAPAYATTITTAWGTVQSNPGTNCTIGRAVANNTAVTVGSTVRSKVTCSDTAADANLPADRMGVYTEGWSAWDLCASSGGWVYNAQGTAVKSVNASVYCLHENVGGWGWQTRKVNSTDWDTLLEITDFLYFI